MYNRFMCVKDCVLDFKRHYDVCWNEMEVRLTVAPEKDGNRERIFQDSLKFLKDVVRSIVARRKTDRELDGKELLVDLLIDASPDEETMLSDAVAYSVGGFQTTGSVLIWGLYFLAKHQDMQETLFQEIDHVLGNDTVDASNMAQLKYMYQVIDETLRCAVVAPWAARFEHVDSTLGGYHIPKDTPVIHALGVLLQDETYWPEPEKFDPERFSPENVKKRPTMTFQPFGAAGKRICPGYRFAYAEAAVLMSTMIRNFKISLVKNKDVGKKHGMVTHPAEEIWVTLTNRQ